MNEKYGIELELLTSTFNKQVEKVKKTAESIKTAFDPNDVSGMKINGKLQKEISGISKEVQKLSGKKISLGNAVELQNYKNKIQSIGKEFKRIENNAKGLVRAYNTEAIQQVVNGYGQVEKKVDKTKNEVKKLNQEVQKTTLINNGVNQLTKGIDKATSRIKRFALSLFSIRSIYALVSKASSAYLAQDTELADKLQSVWAGLGAMLEPIINNIANTLIKAVGYINIFVKALTGVDLLTKASSKSMDKASKSAKGLNKSLAGFDELNNLDNDSNSNIDTGISNPFASIQNVELPWAETIKVFGEWCRGNLPTVIGLLGGISAGIILIKTGLGGILATKFGTTTLATVSGIIIAVTGVIKLVGDLIKYLQDPSWSNFGNIITDIGLIVLGLGIIVGGVPVIIAGVIATIVGLVVSNWENIKVFLQNGIDWLNSKVDWVKENFGIFGVFIYTMFTGLLQDVLNMFDGLFSGIKTIFDGILKVFRGIFTGDMKTVLEGFKQIFKGIFDSLWSIAKVPINFIIRGINTLISGANKIRFDVPDWVPGLGGKQFGFSIPKIPLLNVGTNYVPEDQLAYIHQGEAVIPKKFNSQEYFGSGNQETNNLLEQVIEAINNIEIAPYTTIKDVGQASLDFINGKTRQYGRSVI